MSRVDLIDPAKDERWDSFVENHPYGWIVHLSGWKRVLENSFPHMKGYYLALTDDADGRVKAALPMFHIQSWLTGKRLVSIPFATLCDPLAVQPDHVEPLISEAIRLSGRLNSKYLEIRTLHPSPLSEDGRLEESRLYKNHYLMLDRPLEGIQKSFHRQSIRHKIKRAEKSMLTLHVAGDESCLREFYRLYVETRKRLGLPPQPYVFFRSLWDVFHSGRRVRLLMAKRGETVIAGLMIFTFNGRCSTEYLGSDIACRDLSPDHFLYWQAIQMAHREGFKIFDLGRTEASNDTLMLFKSRWGTMVTDLPQYYYPRAVVNHASHMETSYKYRLLREICRRAPEALLHRIGNFCYRHSG